MNGIHYLFKVIVGFASDHLPFQSELFADTLEMAGDTSRIAAASSFSYHRSGRATEAVGIVFLCLALLFLLCHYVIEDAISRSHTGNFFFEVSIGGYVFLVPFLRGFGGFEIDRKVAPFRKSRPVYVTCDIPRKNRLFDFYLDIFTVVSTHRG